MIEPKPLRTTARTGRAKVTVKEVAALAGVSTGTVSNVLNHPDVVSADTVSRVNRAIEELGWIRRQGAGQIRGGRSSAVDVIVAELGPHTIELLQVLENHLEAQGFVQQVVTSAYRPEREVERVELFEQQRVRGIIISPVQEYAPYLHRLTQLEIPLVLLGQESTTRQLCSVSGDDEAGGRLAVRHLLESGHRRIAVVGGRAGTHQVGGRIDGARQALTGDAELSVVETAHHDIPAGIAAAQHFVRLRVDERPSGVLAINDSIAVGLQRGLEHSGIRVPEDIAVIGYDDSELAQAAPVALTTVRVSNVEMGRHAAQLLLDEIAANESGAPHVHRQVRLRPELVVRSSTTRGGSPGTGRNS